MNNFGYGTNAKLLLGFNSRPWRTNGKVERFHWPGNLLTRGSYACCRPGQYTTIAGAEGRPVGNLFFAGEHCSACFQGYMNGAAETGRMAAQAVLQATTTKKVAFMGRFRRAAVQASFCIGF